VTRPGSATEQHSGRTPRAPAAVVPRSARANRADRGRNEALRTCSGKLDAPGVSSAAPSISATTRRREEREAR
jgi:hypothetical protein